MTLSVIMPVYNSKDYLTEAIRSALGGGVSDVEIIAVDDCSTDGSYELLLSLAKDEPRIKPLRLEKNSGVGAVRNRALDLATGDFLVFCDSDDTVPEGAYSALLSAMDGCDVSVGGYRDVADSGKVTECPIGKGASESDFLTLFSVCCLWTKMIRRDFILQHGLRFDENLRMGEDVVFMAELAAKGPKVVTVDKMVYDHLYHDLSSNASLTHVYTKKTFSEHIGCRRRLLRIGDESGIAECKRYVYEYFSGELDRYLFMIADPEEREEAFVEYKDFLSGYDWENHPGLFRAMHGIEYGTLSSLDAVSYMNAAANLTPRDRVLLEFDAGLIGFKWIIKYLRAWLKYKLKR